MLMALIVTGCAATQPRLDTTRVNRVVTPAVIASAPADDHGGIVQWGGRIVALENDRDQTEIQVLSYPLNRTGAPRLNREPTGRFLLVYDGFLEPTDFAPGKLLTAIGDIRGNATQTIGQAQVDIPVLAAEQLRLWRERRGSRLVPHVGVGISVGF